MDANSVQRMINDTLKKYGFATDINIDTILEPIEKNDDSINFLEYRWLLNDKDFQRKARLIKEDWFKYANDLINKNLYKRLDWQLIDEVIKETIDFIQDREFPDLCEIDFRNAHWITVHSIPQLNIDKTASITLDKIVDGLNDNGDIQLGGDIKGTFTIILGNLDRPQHDGVEAYFAIKRDKWIINNFDAIRKHGGIKDIGDVVDGGRHDVENYIPIKGETCYFFFAPYDKSGISLPKKHIWEYNILRN